MQVQNWMSSDLITVEEDTPIIHVIKLLEENNIRHIPVTRDGHLVGLITDQEIKEASPSKGTTMKAQELYYLLAELKARDVMKREPITIGPDQTMEVAAVKMLEYKVTGLPVVSDKGKLVGLITQGDVFRVLISITGIYQGGVPDVIRQYNGQIVSILSSSDTADEGYRHVFYRIKKLPEDQLQEMIKELEAKFMLLYVVKDPLKEV
ncbi:MAG: CBS domain-containing protein [Deltaproteobacteria bacterium]|nr:CBS domain-containing protein [Deltaproteobacteria bacterium]